MIAGGQRQSVKQFWLHLGIICIFLLFPWTVIAAGTSLVNVKTNQLSNNQVTIEFDFSTPYTELPGNFIIVEGQEPSIVVDFPDVKNQLTNSRRDVNMGSVNVVKVVEAAGRTRAIIDLKYRLNKKNYKVTRRFDNKAIIVTIGPGTLPPPVTGILYRERQPPLPQPFQIMGVDFRRSEGGGGKLVIKLSSPNINVDVRKKGAQVVAYFLKTAIPWRLQRRLDVTDFGTPVQDIELQPQDNGTRVTLTNKGIWQRLAYQMGDVFIIEVRPLSAEAAQQRNKLYKGARISLNFQDIKVRAVLQLLAEFTGINIVTTDAVKGSITLHLRNVPWDQALDIILKSQGLAERRFGNVIMVAPSDQLATQEKQELETGQQVSLLVPLHAELIQINYAKAEDLATLLKSKDVSILSKRGTVTVDTRTNTIWVQDIPERVDQVREFIKQLDIPVRQVLIKSRIVNVDSDFEREIGVKWGITSPDTLSGTFEGANQMQRAQALATALGGQLTPLQAAASVVPASQRLNVDLPGILSGVQVPSIGIALAQLAPNVLLDGELSALESEGGGEVIASPSLITSNQQEASIEQGVEIPYQQSTSSGATSVSFKKAVLSLQVTPQITPDDRVILTLKVNQDTVDPTEVVLGVPAINTRKIQTQVLVNNGETIVLGGIYQQTKTALVQRVPFLGELPIIGRLFRHTGSTLVRHELLIFITPKIVKESFTAQ